MTTDRLAKAAATKAANRELEPQFGYPWALTATACHTCMGTGILTARHGEHAPRGGERAPRCWRWTICPPCRGRGDLSNQTAGWDAGPVAEWLAAPDEAVLAAVGEGVRRVAPLPGTEVVDTTVTRLKRATMVAHALNLRTGLNPERATPPKMPPTRRQDAVAARKDPDPTQTASGPISRHAGRPVRPDNQPSLF